MPRPFSVSSTLCSLLLSFITASAMPTFTAFSPTSLTVDVGEEFPIDLVMDNPEDASINGICGQLTGRLAAGATVVTGQSALVYFPGFCTASQCFGELGAEDAGTGFNANELADGFTPGVSDNLQIIPALENAPTTETGALDPGLDGSFDEPSARDVSVTLSLANLGTHVLTVGGEWFGGGNLQPINSTTLTVTVVPEPATASLIELGLGALAIRPSASRRVGSVPVA